MSFSSACVPLLKNLNRIDFLLLLMYFDFIPHNFAKLILTRFCVYYKNFLYIKCYLQRQIYFLGVFSFSQLIFLTRTFSAMLNRSGTVIFLSLKEKVSVSLPADGSQVVLRYTALLYLVCAFTVQNTYSQVW